MWIYRATRRFCGRTMKVSSLKDCHLQTVATWRSWVRPWTATCGCWKTSEARTRRNRWMVVRYVDLQGNAQVLWENHEGFFTEGLPSPDGRHLAIMGSTVDGNMWMLENF